MYTFSLIDRTNVGGARISGLDEAVDLDVGNRASTISRYLLSPRDVSHAAHWCYSSSLLRRICHIRTAEQHCPQEAGSRKLAVVPGSRVGADLSGYWVQQELGNGGSTEGAPRHTRSGEFEFSLQDFSSRHNMAWQWLLTLDSGFVPGMYLFDLGLV